MGGGDGTPGWRGLRGRTWWCVPAGVLAAALAVSAARAIRPELPFHPPADEAERALDVILHRADADADLLNNLLPGRRRSRAQPTANYDPVLTAPLLSAIRRTEQALVRRSCGGRYRVGEICGLDYSPLTCAQDNGTVYLYRTQATRPGEAIVAFRWEAGGSKPVATYRLLRRDGAWRIDGVRCDQVPASFNPGSLGPSGAG